MPGIKDILSDETTIEELKSLIKESFGWLIKKFQDGSFRPFLRKRMDKNEVAVAAIIAYLKKRDGIDINIDELTAEVMGKNYSQGEAINGEENIA